MATQENYAEHLIALHNKGKASDKHAYKLSDIPYDSLKRLKNKLAKELFGAKPTDEETKKKQAVWKRRVDLDWRKQVEQADVGHVVQLDIVDLSDEPQYEFHEVEGEEVIKEEEEEEEVNKQEIKVKIEKQEETAKAPVEVKEHLLTPEKEELEKIEEEIEKAHAVSIACGLAYKEGFSGGVFTILTLQLSLLLSTFGALALWRLISRI